MELEKQICDNFSQVKIAIEAATPQFENQDVGKTLTLTRIFSTSCCLILA